MLRRDGGLSRLILHSCIFETTKAARQRARGDCTFLRYWRWLRYLAHDNISAWHECERCEESMVLPLSTWNPALRKA